MPPDLSDLLRAAAPSPHRSLDVGALVRRSRRRQLVALPVTAALAVLAVVGAGVVVAGSPPSDRLAPAPAASSSPTAAPLGSGACPEDLPVDDAGQALPVGGFVPEVVILCGETYRDIAGQGTWWVSVESRARDRVDEVVALLSRPDPMPEPVVQDDGTAPVLRSCRFSIPNIPRLLLLDATGRVVVPRIPRDGCGFPDPALNGLLATEGLLTEVAVTKRYQVRSEAQVVSGCQGYKNMIAEEAQSPSKPAVAGPVFPTRPERLNVCVYRQVAGDPTSSTFLRGRWLTPEETTVLVDELGAPAAGTGRCRTPSGDYAVLSGDGGHVLVELGGCNRVLRDDYTRAQLPAPSAFLQTAP